MVPPPYEYEIGLWMKSGSNFCTKMRQFLYQATIWRRQGRINIKTEIDIINIKGKEVKSALSAVFYY